jgi:hypothetical protein
MGGDAYQVAENGVGNRALIVAEGTAEAVKAESGGSAEEPGKEVGSVQQQARTCPVCGTKFFAIADGRFCPVCILNRAFGAESPATGEPGSVSGLAATTEQAERGSQVRRFENYEVMLGDDGRPIELGRGAMGITYKALDVDLRCPVTLKVISERYLGDESAQLRFLREARAAAGVGRPLHQMCSFEHGQIKITLNRQRDPERQ